MLHGALADVGRVTLRDALAGRPGDPPVLIGDAVRTLLGWQPAVPSWRRCVEIPAGTVTAGSRGLRGVGEECNLCGNRESYPSAC